MSEHNERGNLWLYVVIGFLAGVIISSANIWPELFQRLRWAWSGGGGEASDWGEPLFYIVVMGAPAGLIGGIVAFVIGFLIRRLNR